MSPSELAELTLALCRIPSVTGNESACADEVARRLRDTTMLVDRIGNSVVAHGGRTGRPLVLLVGHSDTVPPKRTDGPPRLEGNRLYGLGASDMKGGLAVMLALAGRPWAFDLGLVFYDREEGPWSESGLGPVLEQVGWLREAAVAFCLEPSDNIVQLGCLGTLHARVTFHGRAAHSARPWQGDNAIHKAARLLTALAERPPRDVWCDEHLFREVMSVTQAHADNTRNVIPDRFDLNLNFRFAPGRTSEEAVAEVVALCEGAEVEIVEVAPSGRVVARNPLLQHFVRLNGNEVKAKQAWTDVARLTAAGIDAVNLGPGLGAQAHQAGEYADVDLLVEGQHQFERFLSTGLP